MENNSITASSSTSSTGSNVGTPLPEKKGKNRVSFRTIKFSASKGRTDSSSVIDESVHEIKNSNSVDVTSSIPRTGDYLVLRSDKPKVKDSIVCQPRIVQEEILYLEDIFVVGDHDEAVLELETFEWVSLGAHFMTAEDKDMQHMFQPSKTTDAAEITLSSTVLPPKYFYDKPKENYFVLDGVHRTFYLRKATATHVLALVSGLYDISLLTNEEFWTKNYVVQNWEVLKKKLHILAQDNEVPL